MSELRFTENVFMGLFEVRVGKSAPFIAQEGTIFNNTNSIGGLVDCGIKNPVEFHDVLSGWPESVADKIPMKEDLLVSCGMRELTGMTLALSKGLDPFAEIAATVQVLGQKSAAGTTSGTISVDDAEGPLNETYTVLFGATGYEVIAATADKGRIGTCAALDQAFEPVDTGGKKLFTIPADFFTGTWADGETFTFRTTQFAEGTDTYGQWKGRIRCGNIVAPKTLRAEVIYTFPNGAYELVTVMPMVKITSNIDLTFGKEEGKLSTSITAAPAHSGVAGGHAIWDTQRLGYMEIRAK